MSEPERIFVAVDVANLWKSCRQQFGDAARVDFQVLSEFVPAMRHPSAVKQRLTAYLSTNPKQKHHVLSQVLRSFGYGIRERFMRYDKTSGKPTRTDWDVGITIDAIDQLTDYDTFVLVSGDGDFGMLLEYLKGKGKKTIVLTFEHSASRSLYEIADELHIFKDNIVFVEGANAS